MDHCLAYRLDGTEAEIYADKDDNDFFLMFNASMNNCEFKICSPPTGTSWFRAIDTSKIGEEDIPLFGNEEKLKTQDEYLVKAKSVVVLLSIKK